MAETKGIVGGERGQGTRGAELTKGQERTNRAESRKRGRGGHIFAFRTRSMGAMLQRCIGYARNRACILLANLVYNIARTEQIIRLKLWGRRTPKLT